MKLDSTGKYKIVDGAYRAIDGDWLYYAYDGWLYRSNLDGSAAEKLNNVNIWCLYGIYDSYIFYGVQTAVVKAINEVFVFGLMPSCAIFVFSI